MDVIGSIYQAYLDNVEEDSKTKLANEAMEKEIRGLCDEETARKCVAGDLPVQEYFGKFLK